MEIEDWVAAPMAQLETALANLRREPMSPAWILERARIAVAASAAAAARGEEWEPPPHPYAGVVERMLADAQAKRDAAEAARVAWEPPPVGRPIRRFVFD